MEDQEPSVLDYVKSKLAFWKRSALDLDQDAGLQDADQATDPVPDVQEAEITAVEGPAAEAPAVEAPAYPEMVYPVPENLDVPEAQPEAGGFATPTVQVVRPRPRSAVKAHFPWVAVAPLLLGVVAQMFLEPPDRLIGAALVLYLVCAAVVVLAYIRREIHPAVLPVGQPRPDPLTYHWEGLLVGVLLMLATFIFSGANDAGEHNFTLLNTPLWLISVGYLVWGLKSPTEKFFNLSLKRWREVLAQPNWRVTVSNWAVLLLLVVGVVLFYRFYRLETLPSEMVSDHAEKLLDVQDVLNGNYHFYFPRNTGREFFQFYWTVLMIKLFNLPVSFMALKVGTVIAGLITLLYIYRLGFELGNRWIALFALAFCGVSYWANIQSRIGLRFPLYPLFTAPLLFYLFRGVRNLNRNDFIKAGLVLGLGLHGYTSYRIVPLVVVALFVIYILHEREAEKRKRALYGLVIVALISLAVFMPLARFAFDNPELFMYRAVTRFGETERTLPGPAPVIFLQNTWNAVTMFFYDDGDIWVHSVTHRPSLDVVSAVLFFIGVVLVGARYIRRRNWLDLFLLVSIPLLLLPSILSLAFPNENPNLNRTAGAYIPVFLILAVGLDALFKNVRANLPGRLGILFAWVMGLTLFGWSAWQNYDLLFNQYDHSFRENAWNSTEMGADIREFEDLTGSQNNAYVVAFPYWVDTRLVGVESGHPDRDLAISPESLKYTLGSQGAKLFVLNVQDQTSLAALQEMYPEGRFWLRKSKTPTKDYVLFMVPPQTSAAPAELNQAQP